MTNVKEEPLITALANCSAAADGLIYRLTALESLCREKDKAMGELEIWLAQGGHLEDDDCRNVRAAMKSLQDAILLTPGDVAQKAFCGDTDEQEIRASEGRNCARAIRNLRKRTSNKETLAQALDNIANEMDPPAEVKA